MMKLFGPIFRSEAILLLDGGLFIRFGSVTSHISYRTSLSTLPSPWICALYRMVESGEFMGCLLERGPSEISSINSGMAGCEGTSDSRTYIFGDVMHIPG